jgi:hypothetical protein
MAVDRQSSVQLALAGFDDLAAEERLRDQVFRRVRDEIPHDIVEQ